MALLAASIFLNHTSSNHTGPKYTNLKKVATMNEHATWMLIGLIAFVVICVLLFNLRASKAKKDDVGKSHNVDTEVNSAPIKNSKKV